MKYYKKINIDYYDDIVADSLKYIIEKKPDIYNRKIDASYYILDVDDFKKYCTKLDLAFAKFDLVCNFIVAFVMNKTSDVSIHVDNYLPGVARINIPILNTSKTRTRFFTGGVYKKTINPITNVEHLKLEVTSDIKYADGVEIDQATVIRVNEPHDIIMYSREAPRITLSLGFTKDPVFLLED